MGKLFSYFDSSNLHKKIDLKLYYRSSVKVLSNEITVDLEMVCLRSAPRSLRAGFLKILRSVYAPCGMADEHEVRNSTQASGS